MLAEKKETINKEMDMNLMMNSFKESRRYAIPYLLERLRQDNTYVKLIFYHLLFRF